MLVKILFLAISRLQFYVTTKLNYRPSFNSNIICLQVRAAGPAPEQVREYCPIYSVREL